MNKRKGQVPSEIERVYSRIKHLGRKGEFRKYQGSSKRIWERILVEYRR